MPTPLSIKRTILVASTHHQYSARVARPLKSAYLRIQFLTESCRVIIGLPGGYRLAALVAPGRICVLVILPIKRRFIHLGLTAGARALLPGLPTGAAFLTIL